MTIPPPLVYVGPTLQRAVVESTLPGAQLMPPVKRGDLYRDRMLGFDVFLILDGVFFERLAISPREIVDVIEDGAIVAGAGSMGALRAADCWPAGMHGIGSIYRLYRRGALDSDDEVALTCSSSPPYAATTIPLVNIRYAVRRAVRDGLLAADPAKRMIDVAAALHFSERAWKPLLQEAGLSHDARLADYLQRHDLKAIDATHALRTLRRRCEQPARAAARERASQRPALSQTLHAREPRAPLTTWIGDVDAAAAWRWFVASGRYRRYAAAVVPAVTGARRAAALATDLCSEAEHLMVAERDAFAALDVSTGDVATALASRRSSPALLSRLLTEPSATAARMWAAVTAEGNLGAEVARFTASSRAMTFPPERVRPPSNRHSHLARTEIAHNHGFRSWSELQAALSAVPAVRTAIEDAADRATLGKCVRDVLFESG